MIENPNIPQKDLTLEINRKSKMQTNKQDCEKKGHLEKCSDIFHVIATNVSKFVGNAWVFICMLSFVLIWLATGPIFHFSDTWQLVINTSTSVITFLIVFIIQNTQNRDTLALNIKIDELIRAHKFAHNTIIDLETLNDKQIKDLEKYYSEISKTDTGDRTEHKE